ncbi:MAG: hypothetical protein JWL84_4781 [Rhodospirillales bacterium]|nr:hypothetical protein [Rhodospirillales bacterium]
MCPYLKHSSMSETDSRPSLITNIAASYLRKNSAESDQIGSVISSITKAVETLLMSSMAMRVPNIEWCHPNITC